MLNNNIAYNYISWNSLHDDKLCDKKGKGKRKPAEAGGSMRINKSDTFILKINKSDAFILTPLLL